MSTKLHTLGLVEVTSQRQANNGTVCYHDPVTGCDYLSYQSGYVRRKYNSRSMWSGIDWHPVIYQLNRTRMFHSTKQRILELDPDTRLDMIATSVINYRNYLKK
jgi:hypothetical protein